MRDAWSSQAPRPVRPIAARICLLLPSSPIALDARRPHRRPAGLLDPCAAPGLQVDRSTGIEERHGIGPGRVAVGVIAQVVAKARLHGLGADEQLELALVEDVHEICRDKLVEAADEGVELFFDALLDPPFCD